MSMSYVRRYYGVPAALGRRVTYQGRPGRITSADHRIRVLLDGDKTPSIMHPTEEGLGYFTDSGEQLWPKDKVSLYNADGTRRSNDEIRTAAASLRGGAQ